MALTGRHERLLGVGVSLGEALQRLQLLDTEPAVPEAQGAHLGAVQFDAAIFIGVKHAQVVHLAGGGVVAGIPHPEGHVGQPVEGDGVLLDDLDYRPFMVLEVRRVIPVGVQRHQLAGGILQPGGGYGFLGDLIDAGQEVFQLGTACGVRLNLIHGMAVCGADSKNRIGDGRSIVRVIFVYVQIGAFVVLQHDCADLPGEQLDMMLLNAQNVIVQCGRFHQGIHTGLQALPQNFTCCRGLAIQVVGAVLDFGQPEGNALQRGAVRTGFQQMQ